MLISNKIHYFRNFKIQSYNFNPISNNDTPTILLKTIINPFHSFRYGFEANDTLANKYWNGSPWNNIEFT